MLASCARLLPLVAAQLLAAPAIAQSHVWVVDDDGGPGVDFTDITPAVAAAASGDTILVKDGAYGGFTIEGLGLTIVADVQASVLVGGQVDVRHVAAGDTVLLRDLTVEVEEATPLFLADSPGSIRIEGCTISTLDLPGPFVFSGGEFPQIYNYGALIATACDDVAIQRSELNGGKSEMGNFVFFLVTDVGANGLTAFDSTLVVVDSVVRGGQGGGAETSSEAMHQQSLLGSSGGLAMYGENSTVTTWNTSFEGGDGGGSGFWDPFCTGVGGCSGLYDYHQSGGGGAAIDLVDSSFAHTDCTFTSGAPGPHWGGGLSGPVPPSVTLTGSDEVVGIGVPPANLRCQPVVRSSGTLVFEATVSAVPALSVLGIGATPLAIPATFVNGALLVDPLLLFVVASPAPTPAPQIAFPLPAFLALPAGTAATFHAQLVHLDATTSIATVSGSTAFTVLHPSL